MTAEAAQEKGRKGVFEVKGWLEATTYFALPFDAYEMTPMCRRRLLKGKPKTYDLAGHFLGAKRAPVLVEAKAYDSQGAQTAHYKDFLLNAYSATACEIEDVGDAGTEFLWVTTHPFNLQDWARLTSRTYLDEVINEALAADAKCLDEKPVDPDVLTKVSERVWLLVRHARQSEISLTKEELSSIYSLLGRFPS